MAEKNGLGACAPSPKGITEKESCCDQVPMRPPSFLVMTMVAERGRLPAP